MSQTHNLNSNSKEEIGNTLYSEKADYSSSECNVFQVILQPDVCLADISQEPRKGYQ